MPAPSFFKAHPFFTGLCSGLIIGVLSSATIAMLINYNAIPFVAHSGSGVVLSEKPLPEVVPNSPNTAIQLQSPTTQPPDTSAGNAEAPVAAPQPFIVSPAPVTPDGHHVDWFVQTGAFAKSSEAENQRGQLALIGIDASVLSPVPTDPNFYRVRIGPIHTLDEARTLVATLKSNGFETSVSKTSSNIIH